MKLMTSYLTEDDWKALTDRIESSVNRVLDRYGFRAPVSDTATVHNLGAQQEENSAHERRVLALSTLIVRARKQAAYLFQLSSGNAPVWSEQDFINAHSELHLAITAVEREFAPK